MLSEVARAKVNLTLRVVGRRVDGYHDLESVVAFADCADRLTLVPGPGLQLETAGPLAKACGETADNLVLKAATLLAVRVPHLKLGAFTLEKVLPAPRMPRQRCGCWRGSMTCRSTTSASPKWCWKPAPTCRFALPRAPAT